MSIFSCILCTNLSSVSRLFPSMASLTRQRSATFFPTVAPPGIFSEKRNIEDKIRESEAVLKTLTVLPQEVPIVQEAIVEPTVETTEEVAAVRPKDEEFKENTQECCLLSQCGLRISEREYVQLKCGHRYHLQCFFGEVARGYNECPNCAVRPVGIFERKSNLGFDFGDNNYLHSYLDSKRYAKELFRGSLKFKHVSATIHDENNISGNGNGVGFSLKKIVSTFIDSEDEKHSKNCKVMLKNGVQIPVFINKGYKPIHFLNNGVLLHDFIENGYTVEHIAQLMFCWMDFMELFKPLSKDTFKKYRKFLPIKILTRVWRITFLDIFNDICNENAEIFAQMFFRIHDLVDLGINFSKWRHMGLNVDSIFRSKQLMLQDWVTLGMTIDMVANLTHDPNTALSVFRCTGQDMQRFFGNTWHQRLIKTNYKNIPPTRIEEPDYPPSVYTIED